MRDVSVINISLGDLDHNVRVLRSMIGPQCGLCPIVKADAYGLGAARIAKQLVAKGADLLAVYTADQAAELFRAAIPCRVLVLMPLREIARADELYRGLISDRLHLTVHDMEHLGDLVAMTERYGVTIAVHLEVDTGMSRGGCSPADASAIIKRMAETRRLQLAGLFTHFASAESDEKFTNQQMAMFDRFIAQHSSFIPKQCRIHVASTYAALRHKRYHKSMVRVGLAWAGYGSELMDGDELIAAAHELRPIVSWTSSIVQIKLIPPGASVGYGSTWSAKRASVIGVVPVGYADGYPITLGSRDRARKSGCVGVIPAVQREPIGFAPVVGAVNMDQITVDLTDMMSRAKRGKTQIGVGTAVELISANVEAPNHLPKLAAMAGTIPHEMLCRLNPRLPRVYSAPSAIATQQVVETKPRVEVAPQPAHHATLIGCLPPQGASMR